MVEGLANPLAERKDCQSVVLRVYCSELNSVEPTDKGSADRRGMKSAARLDYKSVDSTESKLVGNLDWHLVVLLELKSVGNLD
jgi:hypothetical protein